MIFVSEVWIVNPTSSAMKPRMIVTVVATFDDQRCFQLYTEGARDASEHVKLAAMAVSSTRPVLIPPNCMAA